MEPEISTDLNRSKRSELRTCGDITRCEYWEKPWSCGMLFQRHGLGEYRNPNSWIFQRVLGLDFDVLSFSHRLKFQLPKLETAVSSIFSAGASGFGAWEAFPNHESIESIESQVTSLLSYHYSIIYITIILISYDTIIITILQLLSYIYIYYYIVVYLYYTYIYILYIYTILSFLSFSIHGATDKLPTSWGLEPSPVAKAVWPAFSGRPFKKHP